MLPGCCSCCLFLRRFLLPLGSSVVAASVSFSPPCLTSSPSSLSLSSPLQCPYFKEMRVTVETINLPDRGETENVSPRYAPGRPRDAAQRSRLHLSASVCHCDVPCSLLSDERSTISFTSSFSFIPARFPLSWAHNLQLAAHPPLLPPTAFPPVRPSTCHPSASPRARLRPLTSARRRRTSGRASSRRRTTTHPRSDPRSSTGGRCCQAGR